MAASLAIVLSGVFWTLSYGAIEGVSSESVERPDDLQQGKVPQKPTGQAPPAFELVGYNPFAELSKANLRKAELPGAQLRNARLGGADLRGANLMGASLRYAVLEFAKLQEATLEFTDLEGAKMIICQLEDAFLSEANLWSADLESANLKNADLTGAKLESARLMNAELDGAFLSCADFRGAIGLTTSQVTKANDWTEAFYDDELVDDLWDELLKSRELNMEPDRYYQDLEKKCENIREGEDAAI